MNTKELLDLVSQWDACQPARDWLAALDPKTDFIRVVEMNKNHLWFLWLEYMALENATQGARKTYKAATVGIANAYADACNLATEAYDEAMQSAEKAYFDGFYSIEEDTLTKIYNAALEEADKACDAAFTAAKKAYDVAAAPHLLDLLQSLR